MDEKPEIPNACMHYLNYFTCDNKPGEKCQGWPRI